MANVIILHSPELLHSNQVSRWHRAQKQDS